jgi:hypothetical protein
MRRSYKVSPLWSLVLLTLVVSALFSSCEAFIGPSSSISLLGHQASPVVVPASSHKDDESANSVEKSAISPLDSSSAPQMQLPPKWKLALAYLGFISFWPFLAFVQVYLRTHEFDIDTYLTVKGLLDNIPVDDTSSGIMELPPLSPAERIVDALFGPNKVDRRGF